MRHLKRTILISGLMTPMVAFLIVALLSYLGRSRYDRMALTSRAVSLRAR